MGVNISLRIGDEWAYLPDDVSISVEMHSPLWNDSGDVTYEFEIPVSQNLHILGSVGEGHGDCAYDRLEGMKAVLYAGGVPFFSGKVQLDDEVEIGPVDDVVSISIVGGNLDFDQIIGDMSARDLELKQKTRVGTCLAAAECDYEIIGHTRAGDQQIDGGTVVIPELPVDSTLKWDESCYNVSLPYPAMNYCNARMCWQRYEWRYDQKTATNEYDVIEANDRKKGVFFYMMYFLESLFLNFDIPVLYNALLKRDELCRVAMMNTTCRFDTEDTGRKVQMTEAYGFGLSDFTGDCSGDSHPVIDPGMWDGEHWYDHYSIEVNSARFSVHDAFLTAENFPDATCKEILEAVESGFCVRHVFDSRKGTVKLYLMDDVLRDDSDERIVMEVHDVAKVENAVIGYRLAYSQEDISDKKYERVGKKSREGKSLEKRDSLDGLNYAFVDFSFDSVREVDYATARKAVAGFKGFDDTMYYDRMTGNAYRVIVDKNATSEETMYPTLMEVAQFVHCDYGDCSDENRTHTVTIGFTPMVLNDVNYRKSVDKGDREQILAVFLDGIGEKMLCKEWQRFTGASADITDFASDFLHYAYVTANFYLPVPYDYSDADDGDPLSTYDCGLTFGIMRGPGAEAGVTEYEEDYDGEGNFKWHQVPGNYALTSDTCDDFGQIFDYNGDEDGMGAELAGRFSLKLKAEKFRKVRADDGNEVLEPLPIDSASLQKRGLFDHLHSLYAYWVVNRRIRRFTGKMELADVLAIDWTVKYRLLDYYGFVNSISFTIDSSGMSDVTIELYYL